MSYKCAHFAIHELVPEGVYKARGELAWSLMDERVLKTIDRLRERYGPMTINNYKWGGSRSWSGLRTPDSPYFSQYSQHTFGRAIDCLFADISAEDVRKDINANPNHPDFELITAIEEGVSWLHIDCRNTDRLQRFYP